MQDEFGLPGLRDPDSPCEYFQLEESKRAFSSECWSDGHYLCDECIHYTRPEDRVIPEQRLSWLNVEWISYD